MPECKTLQEDEAATATAHLEEWIAAQGCLDIDNGQKKCNKAQLRGALRLLYVLWPLNKRWNSSILPFGKKDFALLERQVGLPQFFMVDFARGPLMPTRFEEVAHSEGNRLGKLFAESGSIL